MTLWQVFRLFSLPLLPSVLRLCTTDKYLMGGGSSACVKLLMFRGGLKASDHEMEKGWNSWIFSLFIIKDGTSTAAFLWKRLHFFETDICVLSRDIYTAIFSISGHELQHCAYHSRSFCLRAEPVTVQKNAVCTGREARSISFLKIHQSGTAFDKNVLCEQKSTLWMCVLMENCTRVLRAVVICNRRQMQFSF